MDGLFIDFTIDAITNNHQSAYVCNYYRREKKVFYTVLKRHCDQHVWATAAKTLKKFSETVAALTTIKTQGK